MAPNRGEDAPHGAKGDGDEHHVRSGNRLRRIVTEAVYDTELDRLLQVGRRAAATDHLPDLARDAQGTGQGAADQPDADDREARDHRASTRSRAARKRAFSVSRPTLTRR